MVSTRSTTSDPGSGPTSASTGIFDYAPAPESRSVLNLRSSYGLFIDGEFVDPVAGASFKSISPASEEVLAEIAEGDAARLASTPDQWRRSLDELIAGEHERVELGRRGRRRVEERYSTEANLTGYVDALREAVAIGSASGGG